MRSIKMSLPVILLALAAAGCTEIGSPYGSGYGNSYQRPYYDDYSNRDSYWDHKERKELKRERDRLEDERERLERERDRHNSYTPPPPPRPAPERCPSGFSPSERKCSSEERRRGCQDMRLPGGLGCVRR